ncbi:MULTISPECIES: four helix bundle protein [Chryseobacterium]|uniref:Four helix bundle protein n=1 Tax=Chryseobacterium camelliae TaxID=1265445 RepID=A0ABU0TH64_9FLAO|nr:MULTISPECIES: four helix bundle protein [Chryseobacterium]MDT3405890.1 four helix bundle protein [Pseudacidovorax intermedius]MDQ1096306.1 four helix bundle protein [Chryseobacterium camelliae]MDQ1100245.1 four helix bundle protein [Chryseobacterium sp. SORGH_AS_1048]MDR6087588.1 four helix bundle protein [Chryseobacterium sp. SORGH_AS_0909]MDR6131962.1 four helix bundle protein [Chryseobacterium sp. SORGH_AS_1175]
MAESVIGKKSFDFAVNIINFYKRFSSEKKEFILSKQILRSGTSVGANIREALNAQSTMDFIHKLSISQKECDETIYWLELLSATDYISKEEFESLKAPATEILKMIRSIIITTKNKTHNS